MELESKNCMGNKYIGVKHITGNTAHNKLAEFEIDDNNKNSSQ
jgi:hypothetical protein